jgi:hypothetical protein
MPRGGHRPGAGRKTGSKNKRTSLMEEASEAALVTGARPLDYMLAVMRDPGEPTQRRIDAAKAAAPYMHPRLATVEVKGAGEDGAIKHAHRVEFVIVDPRRN